MNQKAPPHLNVEIKISGSNHSGKTLLGAKLVAFFQQEGIMNVEFSDNETTPNHFAGMVREGKEVDYDFPENTKVKITESHGLTRQQRIDALKLKYLGCGEHHEFTRRMWVSEVTANVGFVDLSYWQWLIDKLDGKVS